MRFGVGPAHSKMFASKGERATVRVEATVVLLNCSVACEKAFFRREAVLVEEMRTKSKKQANRGGHAPESECEHAKAGVMCASM